MASNPGGYRVEGEVVSERLRFSGDPSKCMVIGCAKSALYRRKKSQRGYCTEHKHLASETPKTADAQANYGADSWEALDYDRARGG